MIFDVSMVTKENRQILKDMGIACPTRIGAHKCSVQTRFGWCCDVCLEAELLWLKNEGIHTINSCCGHGKKHLASILVVGDNSIQKMIDLGYTKTKEQVNDTRMRAYIPKTVFPYMSKMDKEE